MLSQFVAGFHDPAKETHRLMLGDRVLVQRIEQSGENRHSRLIAVQRGHEALRNQPLQLLTAKSASHMHHAEECARLPSMRTGHTTHEQLIECVSAVKVHDRFARQNPFARGI